MGLFEGLCVVCVLVLGLKLSLRLRTGVCGLVDCVLGIEHWSCGLRFESGVVYVYVDSKIPCVEERDGMQS